MTTYATTPMLTQVQVPGLSDLDNATLNVLLAQIGAKSSRNALRRKYYDHKNVLRDLGIAIPPQMKSVETVVGWPAKAVDVLSRRVVLDGFSVVGSDAATLGLDAIWDANRMDVEAPQAHTSSLIHATAFLAVTAGDVAAGEPEVIITARSAQYATGIWDSRRRGLSSALSVLSVDSAGRPDFMVMYVPNRAIIMRREGTNWDLRQSVHDLGVPVEPLVYKPMLDRPFGSSRISRAVMSLTDSAVRTMLRTEVSAEFYSAPQRYALGADENSFVDSDGNPVPAWQAVLGRFLALGKDEDGDIPTLGQFSQQSMEPHLAQMRGLASLFASETNLPVSALGIVQDNPASAEAIYAAKEELVTEAEYCCSTFGAAWQRTARTALTMVDDSPAAVAEYQKIRARWRNPATPSLASAADATVKLVTAGVFAPDSEVTWDGLNLSDAQRETLRAEGRRARSSALIAGLSAAAGTTAAPDGVAV